MKIRHAHAGLAVAATLLMGASVLPASAAAASPATSGSNYVHAHVRVTPAVDLTVSLKSQHNLDLCIDDSIGAGLRHNTCNTSTYQDFTFTSQSDGYSTIKNVHTGLCIDDSIGAGLRDNTCNTSAYQRWAITAWTDGTWSLSNKSTGLCIDDSVGAGLRHNACAANDYQSFYPI